MQYYLVFVKIKVAEKTRFFNQADFAFPIYCRNIFKQLIRKNQKHAAILHGVFGSTYKL